MTMKKIYLLVVLVILLLITFYSLFFNNSICMTDGLQFTDKSYTSLLIECKNQQQWDEKN